MFNLGKLTKLFYTFRNIPACSNALKPTFLAPMSHLSLLDVNKQYFGIKPKKTPPRKIKEKTKSAALTDEKAAKLSKAEEEAEAKRKRMEAEKAKFNKNKKPESHIKTQDSTLEQRITKKGLIILQERLRRQRLGLEDEEEEVPVEAESKAKVVEGEGEGKGRKVRVKPLSRFNPNNLPRKERPSLRNKVGKEVLLYLCSLFKTVHTYFNTEIRQNKRFADQLNKVEPSEGSRRTGIESIYQKHKLRII